MIGTNGNNSAICREGYRPPRPIICSLAVNVLPNLGPAAPVKLVNTDVARIRAISIIVGGTDSKNSAICGEGSRYSKIITCSLAINILPNLGPSDGREADGRG